MNKKVISIIFVVAIILQVFVPIGMIGYGRIAEENLQSKGIEYKFKISRIEIFNGNCIFSLEARQPLFYKTEYAVVADDSSDGFVYFSNYMKTKPDVSNYIRFTESNLEKMRYFETDTDADIWNIEAEAYATIKVHNGDIVVTNIYIDEMPVSKWIELHKDEGITF